MQLEHLWLAASRLRELAAALGPHLANSDWHRRRDMIPTLVQLIEVGLDLETIKIVFRDAGCTRLGTGVHCCHIIASVKEQDWAPTRERLPRSCQGIGRGAVRLEFLMPDAC